MSANAKAMLDEVRRLYARACDLTGGGLPIYIVVRGGIPDMPVTDYQTPGNRYIVRGGMPMLLNEDPGDAQLPG